MLTAEATKVILKVSSHIPFVPSQQVPPEYKLLWAILERSLFDLMGHERDDRTFYTKSHAREAYLWFISHHTDPYSFIWICEMLDLDVNEALSHVRHHWTRWRNIK